MAAPWRLVAMRRLMVLTLLAFTGFFVTLAALPVQATRGGAGIDTAGLVTTVMLGCTVAAQLLVPTAVARWGTGPVLTGGLVLLGAPAPLYLLTPAPAWLLAVSAVRGVGFAVVTVLGALLAARVAPVGQRGQAIGLYGLAVAVPNLLAVPAGAAFTLAGSFPVVAVLAAAPLLAVPLVGPLAGPAHADFPPDDRGVSGRVLAAVAAPSLVLLVVTLAGGGLVTFLPLARPTGPVAVLALGAYGVAGAVARWGAGVASDRVGTRVLLPASLLVGVVGLAGVAGGLVLGSAAGVVAAALVFGTGYGAVQNLTLVEAFARSPRPGPASAVWNLSFDAGTGIGAVVVGLVAAAGPGIPGAYLACALVIMATLPLALVRAGGGRAPAP